MKTRVEYSWGLVHRMNLLKKWVVDKRLVIWNIATRLLVVGENVWAGFGGGVVSTVWSVARNRYFTWVVLRDIDGRVIPGVIRAPRKCRGRRIHGLDG